MSSSKRKPKRSPLHMVPLWLRVSILGAVAAAIIISAAITFFPMLGLSLKIPFTSRSQISESEILLKEIYPLFKLTTVEYTYKTVFPFDFIPENSNPQRAYARRQNGEELTTHEQEAARLYKICLAAGIPLWKRSTEFVVFTSRVKGGYNLQPLLSSPASGNELRVYPNTALKTVEIRLPAPEITDLIIQDETSEFYQYPDINVDAEQWRLITEYVEEKIRRRVIEEGILTRTEDRIKGILSRLLQSTGWEEIVFTDASGSRR